VPKILLSSISTPILEKVIQYFHYKKRYDGVARRPKFDVPLELATQVLLAANFLDT
jgi:transcription elongation factor B subunit 1